MNWEIPTHSAIKRLLRALNCVSLALRWGVINRCALLPTHWLNVTRSRAWFSPESFLRSCSRTENHIDLRKSQLPIVCVLASMHTVCLFPTLRRSKTHRRNGNNLFSLWIMCLMHPLLYGFIGCQNLPSNLQATPFAFKEQRNCIVFSIRFAAKVASSRHTTHVPRTNGCMCRNVGKRLFGVRNGIPVVRDV